MADKYEKHSKHDSTRDSRNKGRKSNKDSAKFKQSECKTPPLPIRHGCSIEELMKQRQTIKEELKNIEKDGNKRKEVIKKCKTETKCSEKSKYKHNTGSLHEAEIISKTLKQPSPEKDYNQIDSEDEENIIEQRRLKRKQLLEQLNAKKCKTELIVNHFQDSHENVQKEVVKKDSPKYLSKPQIVTDMFSEEDFASKKNIDIVTQDNNETTSQLNDNWDDCEGYYNIKVGDIVNNNRYTIKSLLGQGVYANVVKAQDNSKANSEIAIKIIRNNELMYKTGLKEIKILKEINDADSENKYHCVRLLSQFMHKGHLCLVFEALHMDLRCVLKKYGKNHGINVKALTSYSRQLLLALRLLKKIGIIHADIKPDNILVNEKKNTLKLCDFGSAMKINDNEPTPYLVSRFYRAPEIILGIPYKHSVDVWSTACTIYEMATGRILFTGSSNNRMLKSFMDLKGRIPSRILRKGKFKDQHFNYNNNFLLHKTDELTGREKVIEVANIIPSRDMGKELRKSFKNANINEEKIITNLKDLLEKMLALDENQRLTPTDCLKHPFIFESLRTE
ncbi:serine/threonine-protein kinase PRP4 homolog [Bicyclus anynana]|uniref:Serine/threonine-protein kinase PRP4 homolog n=1 Tax=Bicyclus anynana TaxID=110368 RepID=A0ABM3LXD9_BICAN|nr:serine/threonine-protein kinase PRP4 homolog [Bicyclus anynana]XP_052743749.1 serine/threonine-protein kinase PRP4 homolog [Bicyclus anynana]XP_052743750.1 serine/threonine-protein kinase PRP4 homolog [Bicyclus anynana]XP_052743751.1 serine/threonine-protein kinase PRP4 homolog [Bicyclus anynana]XP_052743752.1 serine/threonine-protein kinase PRP4 homolog [Bicyclus anynana]XP_052743753.1 serine/threonine-protein kinase PRP4 homolog [Bicyclus anynana]